MTPLPNVVNMSLCRSKLITLQQQRWINNQTRAVMLGNQGNLKIPRTNYFLPPHFFLTEIKSVQRQRIKENKREGETGLNLFIKLCHFFGFPFLFLFHCHDFGQFLCFRVLTQSTLSVSLLMAGHWASMRKIIPCVHKSSRSF